MTGEGAVSGTAEMIAGMDPVLDEQPYIFAVLGDGENPPTFAFACVREAEGTTVVLPTGSEESGPSFARITLQVQSGLLGVGLTAAVATALAEHAIACNVVAGFYHDHLFVPWDRRHDALNLLEKLAARSAKSEFGAPEGR